MSSVALEADSGEFPREASTDEGETEFLSSLERKGYCFAVVWNLRKRRSLRIALLPPTVCDCAAVSVIVHALLFFILQTLRTPASQKR